MGEGFDYNAHGLIPPLARPAIPDGPQTVADVLERALAEDPTREALVGRHAHYRYAELDLAANRAAHALAALGLRPGDRVAATLPNDTEIVVAFLGAMRLGAIWVGINRALAPPEKSTLLSDAQVRVVLADAESAAGIRDHGGDLPELKHVLRVEPGDAACEWTALLAQTTDSSRPPVTADPFAPAAIAYTSGTTGFPKGAVHSQHNLLLPGAVSAERGSYASDVRLGVCLPLSILNLMALGPLVAFQTGGCCVAMDRLDAPGLAEWIREERIVTFAAVPAIVHDLLTHPAVKPEDLASLTRPGVGGASCPEAFRELYRKRYGCEVTVGYGLTEAPTAVSQTDPNEPPIPNSAGRALPQVSLHILDDEGSELGPGELGEICVGPAREGPWAGVYTPMLGYWNKAEASAETLRGGLLHTRDLGTLDAQGNLFVRERKDDLILRGGANIYPAEVERVLHEDPRVAACAVIGRPDKRLGERVVAFVQLEPGTQAEAEELRAHCSAQLARYKVPEDFIFVDEFPRTPMGKIRRRDLRDGDPP